MLLDDEILIHGIERLLLDKAALFLDRDGVIVEDVHHLRRIEDIHLLPGIETVILAARRYGALVAVVTNQSGIARGLFDQKTYRQIAEEIDRRLAKLGSQLDVTVACPFHPDFTPGYDDRHDHWRKPEPGMLRFVAERHGIELAKSILVGDKHTDVEAARRAGLPTAIIFGKPLQETSNSFVSSFNCRSCETLEQVAVAVDTFLADRQWQGVDGFCHDS